MDREQIRSIHHEAGVKGFSITPIVVNLPAALAIWRYVARGWGSGPADHREGRSGGLRSDPVLHAEGDEMVVVTLAANAANIVETPSSATVTIADNDSLTITLNPTGPTTISPGNPMGFSLTVEHPGGPLPSRFQLVLLPEFLGRELSLGTANVTLPAGTAGPIPLNLALSRDIQSLFPETWRRALPGITLSQSRALSFTIAKSILRW